MWLCCWWCDSNTHVLSLQYLVLTKDKSRWNGGKLVSYRTHLRSSSYSSIYLMDSQNPRRPEQKHGFVWNVPQYVALIMISQSSVMFRWNPLAFIAFPFHAFVSAAPIKTIHLPLHKCSRTFWFICSLNLFWNNSFLPPDSLCLSRTSPNRPLCFSVSFCSLPMTLVTQYVLIAPITSLMQCPYVVDSRGWRIFISHMYHK